MDLSIIIPVYNASDYLEKCLNSIINMKLEDYEIILINDGSTDNSDEICRCYENKYSEKIKYLKIENKGCSNARNLGIKTAKGRYITFMDSDDYVDRDYYTKLYEAANLRNLDIIIGGIRFLDENFIEKGTILPSMILKKENLLKNLNFFNSPWNKLYKKELLDKYKIKFPTNSHMGEDMNFVYKIFCVSKKIQGTDSGYYNYINNPKSVSHDVNKRKDIYASFRDLVTNYKIFDKELFNQLFKRNGILLPFKLIEQIKKSKEYNWKFLLEEYKNEILFFKKHLNFSSYFLFFLYYWFIKIDISINFYELLIKVNKIKKSIHPLRRTN